MSESFGSPSPILAAIGREVGARLDAAATRIEEPRVQLYYRDGFLSEDECAALIAMIDAGRKPSVLFDEDARENYRTSESCDLHASAALVRAVDRRLAALLGLPAEHGEALQGQRYAAGQHYREHHDFFAEQSSYWRRATAQGGQRSWTAMAYLNEPEAGGGTRFPLLGIEVTPRAGMFVIWNNMAADGSPQPLTLHEGRPVEAGAKYVATKWFRERAWR